VRVVAGWLQVFDLGRPRMGVVTGQRTFVTPFLDSGRENWSKK
jgi:hypothetical protein